MRQKLIELHLKIKSLTIFNRLLTQPILIRLQHLLSKSQDNVTGELIEAYSAFVYEVYEQGGNFSDIVFTLVMEDENAYIMRKAKNDNIDSYLEESLQRELAILVEVSMLCKDDFKDVIDQPQLLSGWQTRAYDFLSEYQKRMDEIKKCGYGMYAKYHMFRIEKEAIVPIRYPDTQTLSAFSEYERERNLIIKNTQSLLSGGPASNTLLYGDAGTGKSSSIKAIVNTYKDDGLRLIEVKKQQLYQIPMIMEELSKNPLKFILFIDDLSFVSNDENFAALKSILEGGVSSISHNVVIYATSNRRHLLKEDHQSRMGDEVHLNDTLQETMSLSSRFGLIITFNRPEKDVYLHIVRDLAKQYHLEIDENALYTQAEAYAIRHHGRSPRTAKQFIELLKAGI